MNFASVEKIADAVLYEGYILYPYRPSSIKNQQRWNFGTLYPRTFAEAQSPAEPCSFRTELLVEGSSATGIELRLRFLQMVPGTSGWDEGFARARTLGAFSVAELLAGFDLRCDLAEPASEERAKAPRTFTPTPLSAHLHIHAEDLGSGLYRIAITVANETPASPGIVARSITLQMAFNSAHLLLHAEDGAFVSMLEPSPAHTAAVAACKQQGVFPVLVGDSNSRNLMLCSPIILYDYPRVAPESAGDFFDGTEMDEMLALRVLTLTDEEKAEMRRSDLHASAILDRTESLPSDHLAKLHGVVRGMKPATSNPQSDFFGVMEDWDPFAEEHKPVEFVTVFGVDLRTGDRIRLWPQKRADIMDIAMKGKIATIEAIEQDLEGNVQFAVVLEDDPGRDMGMLRQAGHRFFFTPDEIEPLALDSIAKEAS
jgi:hypothetical protein